ncbi:MAG: U32 family peptidase [bacterium]
MNKIELLAPAKDLQSGIAAINCGADAVYIGSPKFGARVSAGNSIEDIKSLILYAHKFWAKVYVTVNTLFYDNELAEVKELITELFNIGADAVIFQDMAILEMDIPPIRLFASTQTNNYDLERIKFLDKIGIDRIILARESSLDQIKEIKNNTTTELESFVFGALCVSFSGLCYLSQSICQRSANRGACSQPCRMEYSLVDDMGKKIETDKNLLSLHDLNLVSYLEPLILAGITSFKIEGRLKDITYVKNITAYFRKHIDLVLYKLKKQKTSSGYSIVPFEPDPEKTFNRGFTDYYITKRKNKVASFNTPKSLGKRIGSVLKCNNKQIVIKTDEVIITGDGLCYFENDILKGFSVNKLSGKTIFLDDSLNIKSGTEIFRNHDHQFEAELKKAKVIRKINIKINIKQNENLLICNVTDEDGISFSKPYQLDNVIANEPKKMLETIKTQFQKTGDTIFNVLSVNIDVHIPFYIPISKLNEIRRDLLFLFEQKRMDLFTTETSKYKKNNLPYPTTIIDYKANVINKLSNQFYKSHGVETIKSGFEISNDKNVDLMTTKYCIRYEIDDCLLNSKIKYNTPLYLENNQNKYALHFDCKNCLMKIRQSL